MSELSPELEELVLACRGASLPTEADSARVFEALRARLGEAAFLGAEATQVAVTTASSGFLVGKVSAMSVAGLALLGGVWLFVGRSHTEAAPPSVSAVATTTSPVSLPLAQNSTPSQVSTLPNDEVNGAAEHAQPRAAAAPRGSDRLAEEVALLSRAEMALRGGKPALALEVLSEHERRFGNGLLAEERIAARVQALCALGRRAEADAQLSHLSPNSLHVAQPGQACGSRKNN